MFGSLYFGQTYWGDVPQEATPLPPDTRTDCGGVFGSTTFGQSYFGSHIECGQVPPPPPPPPPSAESIGGAVWDGPGRYGKQSRAERPPVDLSRSDSPKRKLLEDARIRYAQEHPISRAVKTQVYTPAAPIQKASDRVQSLSGRFEEKSHSVSIVITQKNFLSFTAISNRHTARAIVTTDASYSNGLSDAEIVALLEHS